MPNRDFLITLKHESGLAEDDYQNVLYYETSGSGEVGLSVGDVEVMDGIAAAYNASFLTAFTGSIASMQIRAYAPGLNPTGPLVTKSYAFNATGLPAPGEVAICLSYYSEQNSPRKRGRVYLGPWDRGIVGEFRPAASVRTNILAFARAIADIGANSQATWMQRSMVGSTPQLPVATYSPVTNFYVDDAWDTQRRRGLKPTARSAGVV